MTACQRDLFHLLKRRLETEKLGGRIVRIEAVDKMTDRQIVAKVRQRFRK